MSASTLPAGKSNAVLAAFLKRIANLAKRGIHPRDVADDQARYGLECYRGWVKWGQPDGQSLTEYIRELIDEEIGEGNPSRVTLEIGRLAGVGAHRSASQQH